jgi:hypothetical protein
LSYYSSYCCVQSPNIDGSPSGINRDIKGIDKQALQVLENDSISRSFLSIVQKSAAWYLAKSPNRNPLKYASKPILKTMPPKPPITSARLIFRSECPSSADS